MPDEEKNEMMENVQAAENQQPGDNVEVENANFKEFQDSGSHAAAHPADSDKIEMLMDIVLPVSIELGRTKMYIKDILDLERGSIVEIDKLAGEPVNLLVNNKKMAEGEVVVVDKHFGIRITNLIDPHDRIKNLGN